MYRTDHAPAQIGLNCMRTVNSFWWTDYPPLEMSTDYIHTNEKPNITIGRSKLRHFIQVRPSLPSFLPVESASVKIEFRRRLGIDVECRNTTGSRQVEVDFTRAEPRIRAVESVKTYWPILARKV